jgi:hypothetical protein
MAKTVGAKVDDRVAMELKALAMIEATSVSALVGRAVVRYLDSLPRETRWQAQRIVDAAQGVKDA